MESQKFGRLYNHCEQRWCKTMVTIPATFLNGFRHMTGEMKQNWQSRESKQACTVWSILRTKQNWEPWISTARGLLPKDLVNCGEWAGRSCLSDWVRCLDVVIFSYVCQKVVHQRGCSVLLFLWPMKQICGRVKGFFFVSQFCCCYFFFNPSGTYSCFQGPFVYIFYLL